MTSKAAMPSGSYKRLALLTPVLDDWESFAALVSEIDALYTRQDFSLHALAVDDGSSMRAETVPIALAADSCIVDIEVLRLALNVGHQRAIAVGLTQLVARDDIDAVVVMDTDGEDRPMDIRSLLAAAQCNPDHVILAQRTKRSESHTFRVFYALYKAFFRILTGEPISFGNFCLVPIEGVRHLVHMAELWNNFPISILRSRLRRQFVPTARGRRYAGASKMDLTALIVHGMSAMSVYTEIIFVRLLLGSAPLVALIVVGIMVAVVLRLTINFATPGWTTTVVGVLGIVLAQTISLVAATALMVLSGRRVRPMIPILDCKHLVARIDRLAIQRRSTAASMQKSVAE
jgi:hypothetical protein